jgi:hypothetical protein
MWCNVGKKAGIEIPKHLASRPEDYNIINTAIKSSNIRDLTRVNLVQSKCPNSNMHIARHKNIILP